MKSEYDKSNPRYSELKQKMINFIKAKFENNLEYLVNNISGKKNLDIAVKTTENMFLNAISLCDSKNFRNYITYLSRNVFTLEEEKKEHKNRESTLKIVSKNFQHKIPDYFYYNSISVGEHQILFYDKRGGLYSQGKGNDGQLGQNETLVLDELTPVKNNTGSVPMKGVIGVSALATHSLIWTNDGKVYSFGNGEYGKLGHNNTNNIYVPKQIEGSINEKKIVGASAGKEHSLIWTDTGEIFGFGHFSRTGQEQTQNYLHYEDDVMVPTKLEGDLTGKKVIGASSGDEHSLIWTDMGKLYSIGPQSDHFFDDEKLGRSLYIDDDDSNIDDGILFDTLPKQIEGFIGTKINVIGASAGFGHSLAWTGDGKLYTFGRNIHGRMGIIEQATKNPIRIEGDLIGKKVIGASAGYLHSLVWTEDGDIYSFGNGSSGLGHDTKEESIMRNIMHSFSSQNRLGKLIADQVDADGNKKTRQELMAEQNAAAQVVLHQEPEKNAKIAHEKAIVHKLSKTQANIVAVKTAWLNIKAIQYNLPGTDRFNDNYGLDVFKKIANEYNLNEDILINFDGNVPYPKQIDSLKGKKVIGAIAGEDFSLIWTYNGKIYNFGRQLNIKLPQNES